MRKLYLASPLFSQAELTFNRNIRDILKDYFDVYLPQEDGGLFVKMIEKGTPVELAMRKVFYEDIKALQTCDAFIIILDGRTVDEGAAFELGCAYTMGKPCYGLKTDPRQLLQCGDNPMIHVALKEVFLNVSQLVFWAIKFSNNVPCSFVSEELNKL
jgi:nucleoside 2-deoxyribosyltransferase